MDLIALTLFMHLLYDFNGFIHIALTLLMTLFYA